MLQNSPLNEISGYYNILYTYQQNKYTDWKKWLTHKQTFQKPGKQGIVGILSINDSEDDKKCPDIVYKISQYINYLVQHEYAVMNGLNDISPYCPHFCKSVGIISCNIDPRYKKSDGNPFIIKSKYPIDKEVLLMENVDNSCKFYNYIKSPKVSEDVLYSTVKQVLMAIKIAQHKKQFSHYDLHSFNIMMKKCDSDVVFLYIIDENTQFVVPTRGHYPVIIDFGFSYIKDMDDGPLWPSMGHTNVGFMSDRFDWVADPKLFLVTVSAEIRNKRQTARAKKFRHITKNLFNTLDIDWQSGWDTITEFGAMDHVSKILNCNTVKESKVFDKYEHYCLDLIQTLIILPLEPNDFSDMYISYNAFVTEFIKIEKVIGDAFYNLYILKGIVDIARIVRPDYLSKSTRENAINYFRQAIYERINFISAWSRPKEIHFELMLCSLLEFVRKMEGCLYHHITKLMTKKEKKYDKLPLKSVEQIYAAIEVNIPDTYTYTEKTKVFIFDGVMEKSDTMYIPQEHLKDINNTHPLVRGTYLYNLYKK
jgi:hypothetical protein